MHALALLAEQGKELDGVGIGATDPVRRAGVELGSFAGRQHQVVFAQHQAQVSTKHVDPLEALVHTAQPPEAEQTEQLAARGIRVVTGEVASVSVAGDELDGVVMADGSRHPLRALVVAPSFRARGEILVQLGLEVTETPMGTVVESDAMGQTAVPGVWAAGNVTDLSAQVVSSAAAGLAAGASINADLIAADTRAAVEVYRASR